jgi:predicted nuclease with TOPRIM domain
MDKSAKELADVVDLVAQSIGNVGTELADTFADRVSRLVDAIDRHKEAVYALADAVASLKK